MIYDLHAHPALKLFFFDRHARNPGLGFRPAHANIPDWIEEGFNPLSFRTNAHRLVEGGVAVVGSTITLPEPRLRLGERPRVWLENLVLHVIAHRALRRIQATTPYELTLELLKETEELAANTPHPEDPSRPLLRYVKTMAELAAVREQGQIALYHAIEGGNCLCGVQPDEETLLHPDEGFEAYSERVRHLAALGVRQMGTTHYFDTPFVPQVENTQLPFYASDNRAPMRYQGSQRLFADSPHAARLIRLQCELGIAVDMTHATPEARWRMMDLCEEMSRPPIVSHGCVRGPKDQYQPHPYALADDELVRLTKLGGVVGIILASTRLAYHNRVRGKDNGIPYVIAVLEHIRNVTGSVRCAALGSDFDGLTNPIDDVQDAGEWPALVKGMETAGFSEDEVADICWRNAHHALERAWEERA